jgi:hypothetical protein
MAPKLYLLMSWKNGKSVNGMFLQGKLLIYEGKKFLKLLFPLFS